MAQQFTNNARALLTASITTSATSIVIESAKADLFPVANVGSGSLPSANNWFKATLQDATGAVEIVYVRTRTAGSGVLSNVIRAQEGTTAVAFAAGTVIGLRVTAADIQAAVAVVGANNTFTGSNTFSSPIIGSLTGNVSGTAGTLATGRTIAMTGDVAYTSPAFDGSTNVTAAATLANSGVTAGSYGSVSAIPVVTVDAKGRVTAASTVAAAPGAVFYQNVLDGIATALDTQTFNSSSTWTKPGSGTFALVEVWGAGGSGGRRSSAYAGGGGGGAYSAFLVPFSSLPSSVTVTVGAGGASRTGSDQAGAAGGTSSFGSVLSSTGGAGGGITSLTTGSGTAAGGVAGIPSSPYYTANAFNSVGDATYANESGGSGGRAYNDGGCPSTDLATSGTSRTSAGGGGGARAYSVVSSGGTSTYGGSGSAGIVGTSSAGAQPGGGSGGASITSGVGGAGRVRVTVY